VEIPVKLAQRWQPHVPWPGLAARRPRRAPPQPRLALPPWPHPRAGEYGLYLVQIIKNITLTFLESERARNKKNYRERGEKKAQQSTTITDDCLMIGSAWS
jgi:hypothetical protein